MSSNSRPSSYPGKDADKSELMRLLHVSFPIITALFFFLVSAGYIVYRMVSNYNYNERWKDYDECGLG